MIKVKINAYNSGNKFYVKNPKKIKFWKKIAEYNPKSVKVFE